MTMLLTEQNIKKLRREHLQHMLTDVLGLEQVNEAWAKTRSWQNERKDPHRAPACRDCDGIERALEEAQAKLLKRQMR